MGLSKDLQEARHLMEGLGECHNLLVAEQTAGFPGGTSGEEPSCQCRRHKRLGFDPWVRKIPWRRVWQPTPGFLPEEFQSHGQGSLVGYSLWGCKESDMTEATLHCTNRPEPDKTLPLTRSPAPLLTCEYSFQERTRNILMPSHHPPP